MGKNIIMTQADIDKRILESVKQTDDPSKLYSSEDVRRSTTQAIKRAIAQTKKTAHG